MNKNLFKTQKPLPQVNTVNEAGGVAFKLSDKAALTKLVTVGTISNTFHVSAESQLKQIIDLSQKVPASFIAQLALYARTESFLKDTPALLCAILANRDVTLLKTVFNDVVDSGKMLKNFVQTIRSGVVGRKSFGTAIKKLIQKWFDNRSDYALFKDSIGNNPSLADVIKMVHPSPKTENKEALYAYIIGKEVVKSKSDMKKDQHGRYTTVLFTKLPEIVQEYELYKEAILNGKNVEKVPNVDFQMITALPLKENHWKEIAKQMPFHAARMNLNTMMRHKAFDDKSVVDKVIKTLTNEEQIKKMKVYPYQLLAAYKNATDIPNSISNALQDALEISTQNIPKFDVENIVVLTDSSGSMTSSVTNNGKVPSKVSCIDVASLFASCILRKNDNAQIFAFDTATYKINLNSRDSVMTNASKINKGGGGTDVGQALRYVANNIKKVDVIFIISDNMSWFNTGNGYYHGTTDAQMEWNKIKKQNPHAKIVLLDIQPNSSSQINEDKSVLNCSGFSDNVFKIVKSFVDGTNSDDHFVKEIEKIDISIKNETKDEQVKKLVDAVSSKIKRDKSGKFIK